MARKQAKKIKKSEVKKRELASLLPPSVWPKIFALSCWLLSIIFLLAFLGKAGPGGDWLLRAFKFLVGRTIYGLPLILAAAGFFIFKAEYRHYFLPSLFGLLFWVFGIAGILAVQGEGERWGGVIGFLLSWPLLKLFGFWVSQIIFSALIIVGGLIFWHLFRQRAEQKEEKPSLIPLAQPKEKQLTLKRKAEPQPRLKKRGLFSKIRIKKKKESVPEFAALSEAGRDFGKKEKEQIPKKEFTPYPLSLLIKDFGKPNSGDINKNAEIIKNTLENFGIPVEMGAVHTGPTVAQYTLKPAEGIKLSKITTLNNNLALALAAHPIRIEAPIPGKSLVGIEVPNKERVEVRLRGLLERPEFQKAASPLMIALGRDVAGRPVFADLGRMPHLLVAGATGTGKTIFLNSLVLALLQRNSPETLRFIMIDPKRVEFRVYQEMPHLLGPVIFDANKAVLTLKWLIREMEERFRTLSKAGARDIASYNKAIAKNHSGAKEEKIMPYIMPYIVLVVDELADLMAAKGKEMEAGIVRLAQMARAVGIHLVLATQRPSVEVLTGLIKANITSRITFQVATQVDSRTVLDMAGAERLLGSGDMLFLSAQTPKPKRIQAPFVSDKEVRRIIDWLKGREEYFAYNTLNTSLAEFLSKEEFQEGSFGGEFPPAGGDDLLLEEAKRVVLEARRASASLLQRRLRIGYARAARLLDMLEAQGIVGPADGAKPRKVYGERPEQGEFKGFNSQEEYFSG